MKYKILSIITIVLALVLIIASFTRKSSNNDPHIVAPNTSEDSIIITTPEAYEEISHPLVVSGFARGSWFFEANFPVYLEDANGQTIATSFASAVDDWMTENFVAFHAEIEVAPPDTKTGVVVFEKANPSGLEEHAEELRIPVVFSSSTETRRVALYYYNPVLDTDEHGNILCSEQGLVAVERNIPRTQTPIQDTIRELIKGALSPTETGHNITTEFPLNGFSLVGASLNDGILTLEFDDPNNMSSGGSCRANILAQQIIHTAEQFPEVDSVRFQPETLFQP